MSNAEHNSEIAARRLRGVARLTFNRRPFVAPRHDPSVRLFGVRSQGWRGVRHAWFTRLPSGVAPWTCLRAGQWVIANRAESV